MSVNDVFEAYIKRSKGEVALREKLIEIFDGNNSMEDFCKFANAEGYSISVGEIITQGEEYSCNQLKSTNGGGVNPYEYFDDPFEMFITAIKMI